MNEAPTTRTLADLVRMVDEHVRREGDNEDPIPYLFAVDAAGRLIMAALALGTTTQIRDASRALVAKERLSMIAMGAEVWAIVEGAAPIEDVRRGQREGRDAFDFEKVPSRRELVVIVAEDARGGRRDCEISITRDAENRKVYGILKELPAGSLRGWRLLD